MRRKAGRSPKVWDTSYGSKTLKELETITGIRSDTINSRLVMGWDIEKAISTPVGNNGGGSTPSKASVDRKQSKLRKIDEENCCTSRYRRR